MKRNHNNLLNQRTKPRLLSLKGFKFISQKKQFNCLQINILVQKSCIIQEGKDSVSLNYVLSCVYYMFHIHKLQTMKSKIFANYRANSTGF